MIMMNQVRFKDKLVIINHCFLSAFVFIERTCEIAEIPPRFHDSWRPHLFHLERDLLESCPTYLVMRSKCDYSINKTPLMYSPDTQHAAQESDICNTPPLLCVCNNSWETNLMDLKSNVEIFGTSESE